MGAETIDWPSFISGTLCTLGVIVLRNAVLGYRLYRKDQAKRAKRFREIMTEEEERKVD
jgi:hypothetical protein